VFFRSWRENNINFGGIAFKKKRRLVSLHEGHRSINVELAANQDMFFPFLCMSGRHVIWENTFSTPNSGEHSTRHLQHNAAKAAGQQLTKAEQQLAKLMDSTSPSFLPLRVPPFKASKSRPAAKLLDSRYM
jgi:hypothetical protein